MSSTSITTGTSHPKTPPLRGVFPLDRENICEGLVNEYVECLKKGGGEYRGECKELAARYLECRMQNGLMQAEDLSNLGLPSKKKATESKNENENAH